MHIHEYHIYTVPLTLGKKDLILQYLLLLQHKSYIDYQMHLFLLQETICIKDITYVVPSMDIIIWILKDDF